MTHDKSALVRIGGYHLERAAGLERAMYVELDTVDLHNDGCLGQPGANALSHLEPSRAGWKRVRGPIGVGELD